MSDTQIMPAPEIPASGHPGSKWEREYREFLRIKPSLMETLRGKFVAIHEGHVVQSGDDQIEVALTAYRQFGYQPIFVGLVSETAPLPKRVGSPRLQRLESA